MHGFSHQFSTVREIDTNRIVWRKSGKLILFSKYGCFLPVRFTSYGILQNMWMHGLPHGMHGLPHQSLIAWENTAKSLELGEPGKLLPSFLTKVLFSHQIPILKYTLPYEKWMAFPIISNRMGKCNKIHPGSYQLVFSQNYCFYLFQNLVIPEKNKQKKLVK